MLVLEVDNCVTSIVEGKLTSEQYQAFRRALGWRDENYKFAIRQYTEKVKAECKRYGYSKEKTDQMVARARSWDGYQSNVRYNRGSCGFRKKRPNTHFDTGLLGHAKNFFQKYNIPYRLVDIRPPKPKPNLDLSLASFAKLRDYQLSVAEKAVHQERGLIRCATGGGKCLGRGTPVLMYSGEIKNVEDIQIGDLLMGPDSKPRKVLSICSGHDRLYKIKPKIGDSFVVNEPHILSLKMTKGSRRDGEIVNISVHDYLKQNKTFKHCAKGYRVGVDFPYKETHLDPYFLGLWLGDSSRRSPEITTADEEIFDYLESFSVQTGVPLSPVLEHVPDLYKYNSMHIRMSVLAGLLDSDGHVNNGGYDFISKRKVLSDDVAFISRSLGLRAVVSKCTKTCNNNGAQDEYYRVSISGDCSCLPLKIHREKAAVRKQKKDCLVFGFDIEPMGFGEYFGFEIDGDRLFLLGDFTVTHNTIISAKIIIDLSVAPFLFFVTSTDLLNQAYEEFQKFIYENGSPIKVGRVGGGYKDIEDVTVMTVQTAVRSLGMKYKSYDEEESRKRDKTDYSDIKERISNTISTAKGIISDEVHHWRAETCQIIADHTESARYKFGLSATPYRDHGDDILIDACFGKCIDNITASYLIENKYLIKPNIYFINVDNMVDCKYNTYHKIYEHALKNNELRNKYIANLANKFYQSGRLPLILVKHIDHGELLKEMIPGSTFLHGSVSDKKRKSHIEAMRNKECGITIASVIFDEGIDVKPLDTLILAGSGKSSTRALQRIGRIIRPYPNIAENIKEDAVVVDFYDRCKYLEDHAKNRLKIYKTEPRFDIKMMDMDNA